jgi:hypothetical protein
MRRLLLVLALVVIGLAWPATPAHACSCAVATDADLLARADAVFVGTLVDRTVARHGELSASTDPAVHRFDVTAVYKGEVRRDQEVVSNAAGASCGLELTEGAEVLVFASSASAGGFGPPPEPGQYAADLCNGTRALGAGPVPASYGDPTEPDGGAAPDDGTDPDDRAEVAQPEAVDPVDGAGDGLPVVPLAAGGALLVATVGVLVWRRRSA